MCTRSNVFGYKIIIGRRIRVWLTPPRPLYQLLQWSNVNDVIIGPTLQVFHYHIIIFICIYLCIQVQSGHFTHRRFRHRNVVTTTVLLSDKNKKNRLKSCAAEGGGTPVQSR